MRQYQKQKIRGSSCKGKERSESTGQSSAVTQEERATAQDLEKSSKHGQILGTCRGFRWIGKEFDKQIAEVGITCNVFLIRMGGCWCVVENVLVTLA